MAESGRPTELTEEVFQKIKEGILEGLTLREIARTSEINEGTLYEWHRHNYLNLSDKVEGWKRDRKLILADKNIDKILLLDVNNKDFVRTVSDMSKFVKETLDKEHYSTRQEITGANGKDFMSREEVEEKLKNL